MTTLYDAVHNKDGSLAHSYDCKMAFGRKDPRCPRCIEMLNGAKPREGWQARYYQTKLFSENQEQRFYELHKKTCKICTGQIKGVCTYGDN